jgi:DENN domain-containing protein 1
VLTNITSDLTFGFCRHDASTNVAILIISYFPWHDIFLKFLNVLAEVKKNDGNHELEKFLIESYKRRMSDEKNPVRLSYSNGMNAFLFEKPTIYFELPSIPQNVSIFRKLKQDSFKYRYLILSLISA